jgi:predicted nucleic acid-binding protein
MLAGKKFPGLGHVLVLDEKIMTLAKEYFFAQTNKYTSFVDCANMAAAKIYKLDRIFSFDKLYE